MMLLGFFNYFLTILTKTVKFLLKLADYIK